MPSLDQLFIQIAAWGEETFPDATSESSLRHMVEEIEDELLQNDPTDIEELSDLFFLLVQAVRSGNHSLSSYRQAIDAKLEKNKLRKWMPPDAQGVVRHVEGIHD